MEEDAVLVAALLVTTGLCLRHNNLEFASAVVINSQKPNTLYFNDALRSSAYRTCLLVGV